MSTTYIGNPAGVQAPSPAPAQGAIPQAVIPSDGDGLNVASITQFVKMLTDYTAWLTSNTAILSGTNVWTGPNAWTNGTTFGQPMLSTTGNGTAALVTSTSPATGHRKLVAALPVGGGGVSSVIFVYVEGDWFLEFVVNAQWNDGGSVWNRSTNGFAATKFTIYANGIRIASQPSASPNSWADGAWVNQSIDIDTITSFMNLIVKGQVSIGNSKLNNSSAQLFASNAAQADTSVACFGSGNVVITTQTECLEVDGPLMANGNVSFGGVTPLDTIVSITGNNTHGSVSAKRVAAGDTSSPNIAISFVGGAMTSIPTVVVTPIITTFSYHPIISISAISVTGFVVEFLRDTFSNFPVNNEVVGFNWIAIL